RRSIQVRVASPAEIAGAVEHFFRAELEDHVGMRADEHAGCGELAQQCIEHGPVPAALDRIDPYEGGVALEQLPARLVAEIVVPEDRARLSSGGCKLAEDLGHLAALGR